MRSYEDPKILCRDGFASYSSYAAYAANRSPRAHPTDQVRLAPLRLIRGTGPTKCRRMTHLSGAVFVSRDLPDLQIGIVRPSTQLTSILSRCAEHSEPVFDTSPKVDG